MESQFWRGVRRAVPVLIAAAPFGMLFGAIAVKNGMTTFEAVLMSATVFAGASQMVGIELFGQHVSPALILMSIFAVNFRHVLYSASIGRHIEFGSAWKRNLAFFLMTDPQFAESEREVLERGRISWPWYLGMGTAIWVLWVVEAWIGALFGRLIADPHALGIDFLLPIYFLGLVLGFRKRPLWLPVVAASALGSVTAFHLVGSPWHVTIGAVAGVLVAAAMARPGHVNPDDALPEEVLP